MAPKKNKPAGTPQSYNSVLIEAIRAQNRVVIEAVEATRSELKHELAEFRAEVNGRFSALEYAVGVNSTDLRALTARVVSPRAP